MNKSIRYKLLAYMTVSIVVFALLLLGANTFFAEKYYVQYQKGTLIKTSKEITQLITGLDKEIDFQDEEIIFDLNKLEKSTGVSIVIGKADGTLYYPILHNPKGQPRKIFNVNPFVDLKRVESKLKSLRDDVMKSWERYDNNSYFVITKDPNLKFDTLRYQNSLENGLTILVWIPMAEISESAAVSNRFTAVIAVITILISGLWFFYISDRLTKPIKEINKITKRMADLDFSQTLDIKGEDEIGQLSQSINHLSYRLDHAIGELNRKNKQLEQDVDRSKKIDVMRREFVSNVSHELKTPIFLIQGYAEGLKTNIAANEEKRSFYCDVIMEEAEKMDVIVKDLLSLSQLESDDMALSRCDFDIGKLINETIKKFEPMFKEKSIDIELDIDVQDMVHGDPVRMEQILVNYLNNAINHIDCHRQIKVTAKTQNEKIRVSVFNTGQHIPEELLDRIWLSFYKVDKARTRSYGGTGLGLAIVKAIQQAHNNGYGVMNIEGGVLFWFDLDLVKN
ncbi:MAG TPA: ATP-binding protein [Patescibacteria group bacterium]|nr:ATP-binding protein [Patescibacteria group bacterium]